MPDVPAGDRHAALAVASRRRLLTVLSQAGQPMDAASLAAALNLHLTTTRFHLEILEGAGFVRRFVERGGRPGRPRQLYHLVDGAGADAWVSAERYRQLAALLAEALAADPEDSRRQAEDAGRRWADAQVAPQGLAWDEATRQVEAVFDHLGFAPSLFDDEAGRHIEFAACPFRDLAMAYPLIVCAVHRGLLRGMLGRLDVPGHEDAGLREFVDTDLCVADIPGPEAAS